MPALLKPSRVLANVEARSKKHAFEILSELIAGDEENLSHEQIFDAIVARERIGNTGMGNGVAIPHGKVPELESATAAFLKLSDAIDYGSQDGEPVSMILAIVVPEDDEESDKDWVALGAKALSAPELVKMLGEVSSSRALFELLSAHAPADEATDDEKESTQSSQQKPATEADSPPQ